MPLLHVQAEGKPKAPKAPGADDGEELDPLHVLKVAKGPQAVFDVQYENPKLDLLDRKVLRCVCWLMRARWKGRERLGKGRLQQHANSASAAHEGCTANPAVGMRCGVAVHKQQQGLRLKLVSQQDGLRQPGYVAQQFERFSQALCSQLLPANFSLQTAKAKHGSSNNQQVCSGCA